MSRSARSLAFAFSAAAALLLAATSCLASDPPNWGRRQVASFSSLHHNFADPNMIYAPFAFWFWDQPLNVGKAAEMARVMLSQRLNPGYAHARISMVGGSGLPDAEWLSPKWFQAFGAALQQAEAHHAYLGYCEEYMWPCLQAHGRVLKAHPDLAEESLVWQTMDLLPGTVAHASDSFFAVAARLAHPLPPGAEWHARPDVKFGSWIWPADMREHQTVAFLKPFDLPAGTKVVAAAARISVDNSYTLYLDGHQIGQGSPWMTPGNYDLTSRLGPGHHVLAVKAYNDDGGAGFIFGLTIQLAGGKTLAIASDATWLTSTELPEGWTKPGFVPTGWVAPHVIGPADAAPWNITSRVTFGKHVPRTILSDTLRIVGHGGPVTWTAPRDGDWRLYVFHLTKGGMVNYIDERLAPAFIKIALDPYAKPFGSQMGRSLPGDFMDNEGQYGSGLAWSGSLDRSYRERYGRDIRLWMPLLLDEDAEGVYGRARFDWFDLVSDLYSGNFRKVGVWSEAHGMYTTGHFWEESLAAQVRYVGDHLKQQSALTMPGQDCLGNSALDPHDFKESQSAAEWKGSRFMTEFMGAGTWATFTPPNIKRCTNSVIAWGVSHVIPHGIFWTRKLTGNPWTPDWYNENPMFPYLHLWTDFVRRACFINAHGHEVPDVLLLYPMDTVWALSGYEMFDPACAGDFPSLTQYSNQRPAGRRINEINRVYSQAIRDLTAARIEYLIAGRQQVRQMQVKGARLVRGDYSFRAVVLPPLDLVPMYVAEKIVAFARAGGAVYALGSLPNGSAEHGMHDPALRRLMAELAKLPTFHSSPGSIVPMIEADAPGLDRQIRIVSGDFPMLQHHRRIDRRDFFWLANNTDRVQTCRIRLRWLSGRVSVWNCETGRITPIASSTRPGGIDTQIAFDPGEAYFLVVDPSQKPVSAPVMRRGPGVEIARVDGPWTARIDAAVQPPIEHAVTLPAELTRPEGLGVDLKPWSDWGNLDRRFAGLVDYETTFDAPPAQGPLMLDLGDVQAAAEVWVNGRDVGARLWGPYRFDVTSALKPGSNTIRVRVANLVNNNYGDFRPSGLLGPVTLRR